MKYAALVLSNFKRHKLRTLLTVLSIVVAFILFAYLAAIRKAFDMGVSVAGANRLIVRHKISLIQPLPQSYEPQIEAIDGVVDATQASWFGGIYREKPNAFAQIAVEPEEFLQTYTEFIVPAEQKAKWIATRTGAMAGRTIAERYGWKIGDTIPIEATFQRPKTGGNTWTFELAAIYDGATPETDTTGFFFQHKYLDENRFFGAGSTGWYYIRVADPARAEQIVTAIDKRFENSPNETRTETEKAFVKGFAEQMGDIGAITIAILIAVFITILLVAGNTMAQAVRERINELGVMKAIGFSDGQVLTFVLIESLAISIVGGALGLFLGWLAVSKGDPTKGALPVFIFPTQDLIVGAVIVLLLGLVTGAIPAIQAMRLNAVDALRRE
ncbi:MAG TPA: ABC transporter permease [Thermoanaerobaculia bacterium]|jgi:putative ABC transport system permease protein